MTTEIQIIKSKLITSKYANIGKKRQIFELLDYTKDLKNRMSRFCYENLSQLMEDPYHFGFHYQDFNEGVMYSHTIQTMFVDIVRFYQNHVNQLARNVSSNIIIRNTIFKNGKYQIRKQHTMVSTCLRYLVRSFPCQTFDSVDQILDRLSQVQSATANKFLEYLRSLDSRKANILLRLFNYYSRKIRKNVSLIVFKSGSFRLTYAGQHSFKLIRDNENTKFKTFLMLKIGKGNKIYLPILENDQYFGTYETGDYRKQLVIIDRRNKTNSKKLFFSVSKDETLIFSNSINPIGIDINLAQKTYITTSDKRYVSYPEEQLEQFLEEMDRIDKIGYQNLSKRDKIRLNKSIRKLKWFITYEIAKFLDELKADGITDIVMEDLDLTKSCLYGYINFKDRKIKANRFIRFLKLSSLKHIFMNMCHNKGIRIHLVHPHYTSQQCSKCHNVHRDNRKSQSEFICQSCNHTENADVNAAKNILRRFTNTSLRDNLLTKDKIFPEYRPKKITFDKLLKMIKGENVSPLQNNSGFDHPVPLKMLTNRTFSNFVEQKQ